MKIKLLKSLSLANILALIAVLAFPMVYFTHKANAAVLSLTNAIVRVDRMAASTATTGTICVNPTQAVPISGKVMVTFPSSPLWTVGASGTWTVDTTNKSWPTGGTAWTGVATGVKAGQTVTFSNATTAMTPGTLYCFNWLLTTALTTGTAASNQIGAIETQDSGAATIDSSQVAFSTVANDQVTVHGTINPTFTFTLSGTTSTFASITNTSSDASPTPYIQVVTNARNGWTAWVKDANNGTLNSSGASSNIPTPGAVGGASYDFTVAGCTTNGCFGLGVTNTAGSPTLDAAYDGHLANHAGTLSTSFNRLAYSTTYSSTDQVTLIPRAVAKTTQAPASDYTDLITVIAAGQF